MRMSLMSSRRMTSSMPASCRIVQCSRRLRTPDPFEASARFRFRYVRLVILPSPSLSRAASYRFGTASPVARFLVEQRAGGLSQRRVRVHPHLAHVSSAPHLGSFLDPQICGMGSRAWRRGCRTCATQRPSANVGATAEKILELSKRPRISTNRRIRPNSGGCSKQCYRTARSTAEVSSLHTFRRSTC